MVGKAQRSPSVQGVADSVAAYFVPVVVLAAVVTFIAWAWFSPGNRHWPTPWSMPWRCSSSPALCASGSPPPCPSWSASGGGVNRACSSRTRSARAAESRDTVFWTRPVRSPKAARVRRGARPGFDSESEVLGFAASVERTSEHPLADAIVRRPNADGVADRAIDIRVMPGQGIEGRVGGHEIVVGGAELADARGVCPRHLPSRSTRYAVKERPSWS